MPRLTRHLCEITIDLPPLCKGVAVARAGLLPMWLFCLVLLIYFIQEYHKYDCRIIIQGYIINLWHSSIFRPQFVSHLHSSFTFPSDIYPSKEKILFSGYQLKQVRYEFTRKNNKYNNNDYSDLNAIFAKKKYHVCVNCKCICTRFTIP